MKWKCHGSVWGFGVSLFCSWDEFPNSLHGKLVETTGSQKAKAEAHVSSGMWAAAAFLPLDEESSNFPLHQWMFYQPVFHPSSVWPGSRLLIFFFGGKVVGLLFCGCFCLFVFGCYCCFCCSPLLRERRCKICRYTIVMLKNGEFFLLRV